MENLLCFVRFLYSFQGFGVLFTPIVDPPGLTEIIKFVKPAPIDQQVTKKAKKQQEGGKKKKQEGAEPNLPNAMENMSVDDS